MGGARHPRCAGHERAYQAARNARPERRAYRDPVYRSVPLGPCCARCGRTADLTRDHIVPLSRGGSNDPANVRTLCRTCNTRKAGA